MKKLKLLFLFSLSAFRFHVTYGQSWLWGEQGYSSLKTNDYTSPIATDKIGNAYITGQYENTIIFGNDTLSDAANSAYLTKYNSTGTAIWARQIIDKTGQSYGTSVATDRTGNIYITGFFWGNAQAGAFSLTGSKLGSDVFLVKYNTNGTVLWAKQSTIPSNTSYGYGYSVATDKSGNVFIAGYIQDTVSFGSFTLNTIHPHNDVFIVKYDSNGNVLWAKQSTLTSFSGHSGGYGTSVATDNSGDAYITGYFYDTLSFGAISLGYSYGQSCGFLAKYSSTGNVLWAKQSINGSGVCSPMSVITDKAGNSYITGYYRNTIQFGSHTLYTPSTSVFLTKYNVNGNVIWAKQSSPGWYGTGLASDENNYIYMVGLTNTTSDSLTFGNYTLYTNPAINQVTFLMKFDTSGKAVCGSILNNIGDISSYGIFDGVASDLTGAYVYIASVFDTTVLCGPDTLIAHGKGNNTFVGRWLPCGEELGLNQLKVNDENLTVYPNPFTNVTTIALNNEGTYYLEVDDVTGRKLRYIEFAGIQYQLSAEGLAKGIYFIRAFDNNKNVIGTSKIIVQ